MDPVKLDGIRQWPIPTTYKHVNTFLGFTNFYRKFIPGFADIVKPLYNLTRMRNQNVKFENAWSPVCQEAYETLKQRFISAPLLLIPDKTKPFFLETDASDYATGAVLRQRDTNNDL